MKNNQLLWSVVLLFFLTSCTPILKKFERKKKKYPQTQTFFQPLEYSPSENKELYSNYYFYLISWMQELEEAIVENISRKRILRACSEIIENFNNLKKLFEKEKNYLKKIDFYIAEFSQIKNIFQEKPILSSSLREKLLYKCKELHSNFEKDFSHRKYLNEF